MKQFLILTAMLLAGTCVTAQDNGKTKQTSAADSLLNSIDSSGTKQPVTIFKSTRLVLSQTTKMIKKNNFNFEILHRFGDFAGANGGGRFFYGLDDIADVTLRFEYGISDKLNVDLERSTIGGLVDLELKYSLLDQTTGGSPIAITVLGEDGARPYGSYTTFASRQSYFVQAIFASKVSPFLSLQLAPSFLRDNTPEPLITGVDKQFVSLSAAARFRLSNHMGFIVDYAHPFSSFRNAANGFHDPLGFGIEMETGGHVFTVNITNSRANSEINYLSDTESSYSKGQYRIGFTISRMFDFNVKGAYK